MPITRWMQMHHAIGPETDFTLETNRKKVKEKTTKNYSKPLSLPLGL